MTPKSKEAEKPAAAEPEQYPPVAKSADTTPVEVAPGQFVTPVSAPAEPRGECVVKDGSAHVGGAVNGKVCSAHAMHYDANGKKRERS